MNPPISIAVVIPTMNRPEMLREAIRSVMAQERKVDEIFVSDNHSARRDDQLLAEFSGQPVRYHWHESTMPIEEHWTWCLGQPQTDYVCLLEDDNLYLPDHVKRLDAAARQFPTTAFFGALAYCFEELDCWLNRPIFAPVWRGNLLTREPRVVARDVALASYLFGSPVASSAVMIKRQALLHPPPLACHCALPIDRWLWAQIVALGDPVFVPKETVLFRVHQSNLSKTATRGIWRRESALVTRLILDLMNRLGIDLAGAMHRLNAELSANGRDFHIEHLLRTRDWELCQKLLPMTCEKSSFASCMPEIVRTIWQRHLPQILRMSR